MWHWPLGLFRGSGGCYRSVILRVYDSCIRVFGFEVRLHKKAASFTRHSNNDILISFTDGAVGQRTTYVFACRNCVTHCPLYLRSLKTVNWTSLATIHRIGMVPWFPFKPGAQI